MEQDHAPAGYGISVWRVREQALTWFGRALRTVDTGPLKVGSPQAKGRVEGANQASQDRLVKEMQLRGMGDMAVGQRRGERRPWDGPRARSPNPGVRGSNSEGTWVSCLVGLRVPNGLAGHVRHAVSRRGWARTRLRETPKRELYACGKRRSIRRENVRNLRCDLAGKLRGR